MITGILIKIFARSSLIVEVRDIWPLTLVKYRNFSNFNPIIVFLRCLEKLTYRIADLIVGLMPNLREHLGQDSKWDSKVIYLPIGYEESVMQQSKIRSDWPENLSALKEKFVVGYFGKVSRSNALETLLEAFSKIDYATGVHALLVGDGDEKEHLMKKYSHLRNVTWFDRVSKDECIKLETACDVLYLSTKKNSVFEFGQSLNKLVEYMTVGRPIVASFRGYKNMINEANCGIFVDAEDSSELANVISLWSNKSRDELDVMGGRGREWIQENRDFYKIVSALNNKIRALRH
jgi:glycosyltransferase involved in cell wall biosynthesis